VARLAADGVATPFPPQGGPLEADLSLLRVATLTASVSGPRGRYTGDPLEVAILEAAETAGLKPDELRRQFRRSGSSPSITSEDDVGRVPARCETLVYAKGAPEVILARSSKVTRESREIDKTKEAEAEITKRVEEMAADAMRVIAFACKRVPGAPT